MSSGPPHTDPVTELLLAQAGEIAEPVTVLDDVEGALTKALVALDHRLRVWCDDVRSEALAPETPMVELAATPAAALIGPRTLLWRLPRAVAAVEGEIRRADRQAHRPGRPDDRGRTGQAADTFDEHRLERSFDSVKASGG